jgi:hypothetical protein
MVRVHRSCYIALLSLQLSPTALTNGAHPKALTQKRSPKSAHPKALIPLLSPNSSFVSHGLQTPISYTSILEHTNTNIMPITIKPSP